VKPKLYTLRTELCGRQGGRSTFTRFGFREVWTRDAMWMLNGKKLWLAGRTKASSRSLRTLNDERTFGQITPGDGRTAGLNALHGHWDRHGRPWAEFMR